MVENVKNVEYEEVTEDTKTAGQEPNPEVEVEVEAEAVEEDRTPVAIQKARNWWGVGYPENMVEDWEERIADIVQVPFAYCIHDKDVDSAGQPRKTHVHLMLTFSNTTTYKHAMNVFRLLGAKAFNKVEAVVNIRNAYDYLIHDTEACRKKKKHAYDQAERICGNNFDIGNFEQLSKAEKDAMFFEVYDFIIEQQFVNMRDFYIGFKAVFMARNTGYGEVYRTYNAAFERACKGNYQAGLGVQNRQNQADLGVQNTVSSVQNRQNQADFEGSVTRKVCNFDKNAHPKKSLSKAELVAEWQELHPAGNKSECARELGFSRHTIIKYWCEKSSEKPAAEEVCIFTTTTKNAVTEDERRTGRSQVDDKPPAKEPLQQENPAEDEPLPDIKLVETCPACGSDAIITVKSDSDSYYACSVCGAIFDSKKTPPNRER